MNLKLDKIDTLYNNYGRDYINKRYKDILDKEYYVITSDMMLKDSGYFIIYHLKDEVYCVEGYNPYLDITYKDMILEIQNLLIANNINIVLLFKTKFEIRNNENIYLFRKQKLVDVFELEDASMVDDVDGSNLMFVYNQDGTVTCKDTYYEYEYIAHKEEQ